MGFKISKSKINAGDTSLEELMSFDVVLPPEYDIKMEFINPGEVSGIFKIYFQKDSIIVSDKADILISLLLIAKKLNYDVPNVRIYNLMSHIEPNKYFDIMFEYLYDNIIIPEYLNTIEKIEKHICICLEVDKDFNLIK